MTEPKNLPVWQSRDKILDAIANHNVIIVESPTGSGKTTQIPLILKQAGYASEGIIGITQPRRIATLSVCSFIKKQIEDENLSPNYCGYKMRFYDTTDSSTKIKVLTDGMLLQELKTDSLLSSYSVIMIDEAHERSLNIDFILGLLKQILEVRKDFKVIISSATLNTKVFSKFFSTDKCKAPIISIEARQYNVDVKYYPLKIKNDTDQISHSICQIISVLLKNFKASGYKENKDTLVFLPGEFDIKTVLQDIYSSCSWEHLEIYPLYGRLNKEEQEQVFTPTSQGKMKVVLATNIAETSLTIDGIQIVIDSGLSKINYYNQYDFTSSLVTRPISRSSAMQRTGRAGRTCDGTCYRLFSKEDFDSRQLFTQEEILRTDLSEVVLRMVDLGITDFEHFPYITKPDPKAIKSGENTLIQLGAIDKQRHLTEIGKLMVAYPLLPRHSRCVVQALKTDPQILRPICICISFLSCKTPFVLPPGEEDNARLCHRRFSSEFGDFIGYQLLFKKYSTLKDNEKKTEFCNSNYLDKQCMDEIVHVTEQLCSITSELGVPVPQIEISANEEFAGRCMKCLCKGLIQYVCIKKQKSVYRTITTDEIYIHPGSAYFKNPPQFLLAGEIVLTSKMYARTVSPISAKWLREVEPSLEENLRKLSKNNHEEKNKKEVNIKEKNKKTVNLFGLVFPIVFSSGKNSKPVTVIPSEDLRRLTKAYKNSSRHPNNMSCAILFNGCYIHYGDRLIDIIRLAKRINFTPASIVNDFPKQVFFPDTIREMIPNLKILMKFCRLAKYKDRIGFVELITTGRGIMFHVNANFSEAINNTAYSLLTIMDQDESLEFKRSYNEIVRLLD